MNIDLWKKIEAFPLEDPKSGLPFSARLARENGWDGVFANRVIDEYRKFLYLCSEAGHSVTPSDAVDQAWHLHLCYTESYWTDLCKNVLGRPLHHGPTKGGKSEREKFHDLYERTLDSYRETFGHNPPSDLWPPSALRFGRQNFQRIDTAANYVVSRKKVTQVALGIGTCGLLASCVTQVAVAEEIPFEFFVIGFFLLLVIIAIARRGGGGTGGGSGGDSSGGGGWWFGSGCSNDSGCGSGCGGGCGS